MPHMTHARGFPRQGRRRRVRARSDGPDSAVTGLSPARRRLRQAPGASKAGEARSARDSLGRESGACTSLRSSLAAASRASHVAACGPRWQWRAAAAASPARREVPIGARRASAGGVLGGYCSKFAAFVSTKRGTLGDGPAPKITDRGWSDGACRLPRMTGHEPCSRPALHRLRPTRTWGKPPGSRPVSRVAERLVPKRRPLAAAVRGGGAQVLGSRA